MQRDFDKLNNFFLLHFNFLPIIFLFKEGAVSFFRSIEADIMGQEDHVGKDCFFDLKRFLHRQTSYTIFLTRNDFFDTKFNSYFLT